MDPYIDEIRTLLTGVSVVVALLSARFARMSWKESYRPIVTAFVSEHKSGNSGATYNLVISNSGNRPATHIQLRAKNKDIEKLVDEHADEFRKERIFRCFKSESMVSVLRNGEELATSFGAVSKEAINGHWLNYGVEIQIEVLYKDLLGKKYRERMPLKLYVRNGFGGGIWGNDA